MAQKKRNLGPGFLEEVTKATAKVGPPAGGLKKGEESSWTDFLLPNFHPENQELPKIRIWRIVFFLSLCLVLFFIIFLRLFHLQIVEGKSNRALADGNRIQVKVVHAPRGVIFDRNGKILAANSPAFRLNFSSEDKFKTKYVTREEALEWEVKNDPRVLNLEVDNVRTYSLGAEFAHVVGFLGEITENQLKSQEFKDYHPGDVIGQIGIEAQYEKILRGTDGGEIIEVDSTGRKLRTLRHQAPIPGQNIYLSIDASLQEKLFELMKEALSKSGSCCAAAVAEDPTSGKILALVSLPSFDPNVFSQNDNDGIISEILSRSDSPILNRVIGGTYPPGSTFKIIPALAALASGKISPDTVFEDTGVMYLGSYRFSNWYFNQYGKTEGFLNLTKAIERSNDTYFYKIAQIVGEGSLVDWAGKLNLGGKLGIDLPGEETGLIPTNEWKQNNFRQPWYPGDTLHMAIGQGFVLATPLQILGITSYIAGEGILYKPELLLNDSPKIIASNLLSKEHVAKVKEGMKLVPQAGGTAWPFFSFPIPTAGKTGTAEYGDPKGKTHAWYTSFAPVDDPKIALTVLVEGGGEGSSVAAPIVKEVYRWYFSPDKNKLIQDVYGSATESGRVLGE
ncbi:MAG: penicillin-binding protein 2 [Candidatus Daviesbacteria bacterium]|nr:penicillin-binding protein 2 [Candidatus Daviesbacteria bacterium]